MKLTLRPLLPESVPQLVLLSFQFRSLAPLGSVVLAVIASAEEFESSVCADAGEVMLTEIGFAVMFSVWLLVESTDEETVTAAAQEELIGGAGGAYVTLAPVLAARVPQPLSDHFSALAPAESFVVAVIARVEPSITVGAVVGEVMLTEIEGMVSVVVALFEGSTSAATFTVALPLQDAGTGDGAV